MSERTPESRWEHDGEQSTRAPAPTPYEGPRLSEEQPWDESIRPTARREVTDRDYTP